MTFGKDICSGPLDGFCVASSMENQARLDVHDFADACDTAPCVPPLRQAVVVDAAADDDMGDAPPSPARRLEVLGDLADGLAHDFNNLLTIILGNLERLMDRSQDPELRRRVNMAREAAIRGERLIRSLLSFAQCRPVERNLLNLNSVIRDMEPLLVHCLEPRVQLITRLDADAPVEADMSQTEMAILNLAVNARDAMAGNGVLRIETANRTLSGEHDGLHGCFIALTVTDTGSGMSPEVLARAFEPYFTTKPDGRGTGLGLSTVRDFAKRVRGTVAIESALGRGTTVTVYLPRGSSSKEGVGNKPAESDGDR